MRNFKRIERATSIVAVKEIYSLGAPDSEIPPFVLAQWPRSSVENIRYFSLPRTNGERVRRETRREIYRRLW